MLARIQDLNLSHSKIRSIFWSVLFAVIVAACTATAPSSPTATPGTTATELPAKTEPTGPSSATPQPTALPRAFVLKVPAEWSQAAAEAIKRANAGDHPWTWQLDVGQPLPQDLQDGWADAVLIEGAQGTLVGRRPIALAVPFSSHWEDITLQQAQDLLDGGSEFVEVMDWADLQPWLKSITVDGHHPSDEEYPLQRSWSIVSSAQAQPALIDLLPALKGFIEHDPHIRLAAVGDLMLARTVGEMLEAGDLEYPFENVAVQLQEADITIGNLESALGTGGAPEDKGYTFRAPPQAAPALASAGFDLLSLANNHAMDYGHRLLVEAIAALDEHGIATVGAGENDLAAHRPYLMTKDDLKIAILSFVDVPQEFRGFDTQSWQASGTRPGVAWADPERMRLEIEHAGMQADLVIVLLHSGYEYVPQPSPPQIAAARAAIEAGADLVLGHHAHVLQPVEFHPLGVIVYGLGNFVFEDAGPPESALLKVWLDEDGVRELQFFPVRLDAAGIPVPASREEAQTTLNNIHSYSDSWRSQTPTQSP